MSKKARRARKPRRTDVSLRPVDLQQGMSAGTGYRIRLARAGEVDIVRSLLIDAGAPISEEEAAVLESGSNTIGAGALNALTAAQPFHSLSRTLTDHASAGELLTGMLKLATLLVVTTMDDKVVGVLDAHPPGKLLPKAIDAGIHQNHALFSLLVVIKISGLAIVPEHRGNRLGASLVKRCTQMYFQLGYQLAYGQFDTVRNLDAFYSGQGFKLLRANQAISLEERLTLPINLGADTGEQMFYKWNPN